MICRVSSSSRSIFEITRASARLSPESNRSTSPSPLKFASLSFSLEKLEYDTPRARTRRGHASDRDDHIFGTYVDASDMPKTFQIRNVPDELHRELKARAAREGTTLWDYVLSEKTDSGEADPSRPVGEGEP